MIARLRSHQVTHAPEYYLTATPPNDDLAKTLTIFLILTRPSLMQEVDEEKVEDPLTGLSGNSSDLSDSEKSSSMQDLKTRWVGDLNILIVIQYMLYHT